MAKKTPLFNVHKTSNATMVEFAGWEMPVYYTGILTEHQTVRQKVGIFDVSHMGEIEVRGKDALLNLQRLLVRDIKTLSVFQVRYSALCYPEGGVVDDVTVYRLAEDRSLLCVNASNTEKDYQWILEHLEGDAVVVDRSAEFAQLAIQGPRSMGLLQKQTPVSLGSVKYYRCVQGRIDGVEAIISRTGYTGEDGFEVYFSPEFAIRIWERLMAEGKICGVQPIGLGARDTLRLEMAFPLYGHELNATNTLIEAGLERIVDFSKGPFIGREVLLQQKTEGIEEKLVGFKMEREGIPRAGYEIYNRDKKIGIVTSGTMSPTLRRGIGLGYVAVKEAMEGRRVD